MDLITLLKFLTDSLAYWTFASFCRAYFSWPLPQAALLIPLLIYAGWMVRGQYFGADYDHQLDKFRKLNLLFLILPFLALLRIGDGEGTAARLLGGAVPPLITYYLLQMLLFRILRQDPAVRREPRFRLVNLLLVAGTGALGILLTSSRILYGASRLILLLWKGPVLFLISLVLRLFSYTLGLLIYGAVMLLIRLLGMGGEGQVPEGLSELPEDPLLMAESIERGVPSWVSAALGILAAALVLYAAWKLFRMLADKSRGARTVIRTGETRSRIPSPKRSPGRGGLAGYFHPAERIRRSFRRFMKLLASPEGAAGDTPPRPFGNAASADILAAGAKCFPEEAGGAAELTGLYRRARYEDMRTPVTAADAARAEALLRKISSGRPD